MPPISLGKGPVPIFPPDVKNFFDKLERLLKLKVKNFLKFFVSGSMAFMNY